MLEYDAASEQETKFLLFRFIADTKGDTNMYEVVYMGLFNIPTKRTFSTKGNALYWIRVTGKEQQYKAGIVIIQSKEALA